MEDGLEKQQRRVEISKRMKAIEVEKKDLQAVIDKKVAEELLRMRQLDFEYAELDRQIKS